MTARTLVREEIVVRWGGRLGPWEGVGWIVGWWEAAVSRHMNAPPSPCSARSVLFMPRPLVCWYSRRHMVAPNSLGVVPSEELLGCSCAVRFLSVITVVPAYYPAWELYLDTFLSSPQTSDWTPGIRRAIIWARRFPLGDCDVLDICFQIRYVHCRTHLSVNHCDFSQMDGWVDKPLTKCLVNTHQGKFRYSAAQRSLPAQWLFECMIDILETGISLDISVSGGWSSWNFSTIQRQPWRRYQLFRGICGRDELVLRWHW